MVKSTLKNALETFGYDNAKIESIVQIFHILGIFDNKFNGSVINSKLSDQELERILNSDLESSNIEELKKNFNDLGQTAFKVLRGTGERQQMHDVSCDDELKSYLRKLNNIQEIKPDIDADIYAVFGASQLGLKSRLQFLNDNVPDFTNKKIYILTGNRKLWPIYTGDNEVINSKNITGEDLILDLIRYHNPSCDITAIENDINSIFEEYEENDFNLSSVRKRICNDIEKKYNIRWPNESDLSDKLAREIFPEKNIIICNGGIDPRTKENINRPTTETTLRAFRYMTRMEQLSGANFCFVSSQPYCTRQTMLAQKEFGSNVKGCAKAASNVEPNVVLESLFGEINSLTKLKSIKKDSDFFSSFMNNLHKGILTLNR